MLCNLAPCAFVCVCVLCVSIVIQRLSDFPTDFPPCALPFSFATQLGSLPSVDFDWHLPLLLLLLLLFAFTGNFSPWFHFAFWVVRLVVVAYNWNWSMRSTFQCFDPVSYLPSRHLDSTISRQLQFSLAKCFKLPLESRNLALFSACQQFPSYC